MNFYVISTVFLSQIVHKTWGKTLFRFNHTFYYYIMILFINIQLFLLFSQNPQFSHIHTHKFNSYQMILTDCNIFYRPERSISQTHHYTPSPTNNFWGIHNGIILSVHMYCKCNSFLMNELILMNFDTLAVYNLRMSMKEDNPG